MPHSYVSCRMHYIFSIKNRKRIITPEMQPELWAYMGGIAREHGMKVLAVGGTDDHAHMLLGLPSTMSTAKGVQLVKGGSSKWLGRKFPAPRFFEWQEGYGAFGVAISGVEDTIDYIANQKEHHRHRTFKEEFLAFLKKHGIEYDERYVWG